jgi:aquaporin Z
MVCASSLARHREWLAEGACSGIFLFAVVTAKDLAVRAGPPSSELRWSIAIVAVVAGLTVIAVAFSALGRRSGAHISPAVTMGLWLQRTVSPTDLAGYWAAQLAAGALAAVRRRPVTGKLRHDPAVPSTCDTIRACSTEVTSAPGR